MDIEWREKLQTSFNSIRTKFSKLSKKSKRIIYFICVCLVIGIFYPISISPFPQMNGVDIQPIHTNEIFYRPNGYECIAQVSNKGAIGKGLVIKFITENDGEIIKHVYINSNESKQINAKFSTNTIGEKIINVEVYWEGLFNIWGYKVTEYSDILTVFGADYYITILENILNRDENNIFKFRVSNIGNIKADKIDVQLTNLGKLQLKDTQTKTVVNFNVTQEIEFSYIISVPSKDYNVGDKVDLTITIETTYPNGHEPFSYDTNIEIQENSTVATILSIIVIFGAIGLLVKAYNSMKG